MSTTHQKEKKVKNVFKKIKKSVASLLRKRTVKALNAFMIRSTF
jgi:hypothetical protein